MFKSFHLLVKIDIENKPLEKQINVVTTNIVKSTTFLKICNREVKISTSKL